MSSKQDIRIALVGGGLGGVCAAVVLGRLGYDVHIFEQASGFGEIGAGIGLGPSALAILKKIGMYEEYAKVATIIEPYVPFLSFHTWDGKAITKSIPKESLSLVHRARALESFMKCLPSTVTPHFSSHISKAENTGTGVRLTVSSATSQDHSGGQESEEWTFEATIAIGCDGIKSSIRNGLNLPGGRVRYTGTYAYRSLIKMEDAVALLGESIQEPTMWLGHQKHVLAAPIDNGNTINLVAFVSDRSQPEDERTWAGPWVKSVPKEILLSDFEGWNNTVQTLLKLVSKPVQWAMYEMTPLEKWTVDRITLLGDSAHASLPHNGSGAGQAIEDVYVLGQLLSLQECTAETIPRFLQAYEDARRWRASRQQTYSRETGEIWDYASPIGDNLEELKKLIPTRFDWIWYHDFDKDVDEVKAQLRAEELIA